MDVEVNPAHAAAVQQVDPCPLCGAQDARPLWQVPYEHVWRQLREQWGVDVPVALRGPWDKAGAAVLGRCSACALEYFSPLLPAGGSFYELLSDFYVDDRWEFEEVRRRLRQDDSVIDFGCGRGAFLTSARPQVRAVVGCDFNPTALDGAAPSFEVLPAPFTDAAASRPSAFSVAVSFHVLEHLRDAREILDAARTALCPGGRLFLSTPDRERTARAQFEVFDCPPHHVSRWSGRQFRELAEHHGWELVRVDHEPFVHRTGRRRLIPTPALYAAGVLKHARRGSVQRPQGMRVGTAAERWPRGLAVLAELHLPDRQ
jgi:SAM-dependent methyltransferase